MDEVSILGKVRRLVAPYWRSDQRGRAWTLLAGVVVLTLLLVASNVIGTYVTRWFMNTLEARDPDAAWRIIRMAVVILVLAVPVHTYREYLASRLVLAWREWLTVGLLERYFRDETYYRVHLYSDIDNVDQRLQQDTDTFVTTSVALFGTLLLQLITLVSFLGVLESISGTLVAAAFAYALVGSVLTILVGRPLVPLNFANIRLNADFRYNLVHVRDNLESIAFYRGEERESRGLFQRFGRVLGNFRSLIDWQRNVGFVTNAYTLLSVLVPYMLLTPGFFSGTVDLGTIAQSTAAFSGVLIALSIVVNEFQTLTAYAAVVERLYGFVAALDVQPPPSSVIRVEEGPSFELAAVTVVTPDLSRTLVTDLTIAFPPASGTMIVGRSGCGKSSLLRGIAGLWRAGQGSVLRPPPADVMFLPQKPYMIVGSLREQLLYPRLERAATDDELREALAAINLEDLPDRVGGFDRVAEWSNLLSLGEQQRLIFARLLLVRPRYAILDEATSALDERNEQRLYTILRDTKTTYVSVGHRSSLLHYHDAVLELVGPAEWHRYTSGDFLATRGMTG